MSKGNENAFNRALQALTRFQATEAVYEDSAAVAKMLRNESDRALVIILASYVEDALLDRIIYFLPEGERYGATIFKGGSLRNFEHRIAIAKALGAIDENKAQVLEAMRAMRNACSHSRKPISFKTSELLDVLAATTGKRAATLFRNPDDIAEIRGDFIAFVSLLLWTLRSAPGEAAYTDSNAPVPQSVRTEKLLLVRCVKSCLASSLRNEG